MKKVKVLFCASSPGDTSALRLDEEIRAITQKIRSSQYRDSFELVSAWAIRPDDLIQELNEHKPDIIHFSMHGEDKAIILMDDDGMSRPVEQQAIIRLLKTFQGNVRVVLLNACYSLTLAKAITKVVDCAIGMDDQLSDRAAICFAASFYRAIGFGRSVREAVEQGKTALLLDGYKEEITIRLMSKRGIDPDQVMIIEAPGPQIYTEKPNLGSNQIYPNNYEALTHSSKSDENVSYIELEDIDWVDEYQLTPILTDLSHIYHTMSIIYCDIDGLLGINKVFGTLAGNEVIRQVGGLLRKCVTGSKIYRIRGDQFVIVLTQNDQSDALEVLLGQEPQSEAMKVAQKCRRLIKSHSWSSIALDLHISCTFSVTQLQPNEKASRCLLRLILGVKEAKNLGKDQVVQAPLSLRKYDDKDDDYLSRISGSLS